MTRRIILPAVLCLIVGFIGCLAYARSIVPPPTVAQLSNVWIGLTKNNLYFYRLELHEDGTGLCASAFVDEPAQLYEVTKWSVKKYKIKIELKPIDKYSDATCLKGSANGSVLKLEASGKDWCYKQKLQLHLESHIKQQYNHVIERMKKHAKDSAEGG